MSKTVFITGARRGIGKAISDCLREQGYEIIAPSREALDLSSQHSVQRFLAENAHLEADILINNAGENKVSKIEELSLEAWERILTVNLTSSFLLCQHFAKQMAAKNWGRIINISSVYSLMTRNGRAAYSASKSGLNGLTRTLALEYGSKNVLVNSVCPGFVDTDLTRQNNPPEQIKIIEQKIPMERLARPSEIAEFIAFLVSDKNTYLTGQTLVVDGGFTINGNL